MKKYSVIPLLPLLMACATTLDSVGSKVHIVPALTATDFLNYDEAGPISCYEPFDHTGIQESCENDLRNKAGGAGATVVVMKTNEKMKCTDSRLMNCVKMTGTAYKPKPKQK